MEIFHLLRVANIMIWTLPFVTFALPQVRNQNFDSDIDNLSSVLPGCYSNAKQYYAHAMNPAQHPKRRLILLRVEFFKMESPLFNDSLTIYFQDFTKSSKVPFSSGFYSFSPDPETNTIRMKIFKFQKPVQGLQFIMPSNYSIPRSSSVHMLLVRALDKAQMKTHPSCDMLWKKISPKTFMGITTAACLASLGESSVRISVSMTLTSSRITLTEGWYNVDERARLRELKIPYVLKRKTAEPREQLERRPLTQPQLTRKSEIWTKPKLRENINTYQRLRTLKGRTTYKPLIQPQLTRKSEIWTKPKLRENINTYQRLRTLKGRTTTYKKPLYAVKKLPSSYQSTEPQKKKKKQSKHFRKRRVLRSFRQVESSLMSGKKVFYRVNLSGCSMPSNAPDRRMSFGGQITTFLVIVERHTRKKKSKIYFSTLKTSMGARGAESIQREMTLNRRGQVEVKVTKRYPDPRRIPKEYTFQCRMFKNKKRKGSVRIYTDKSWRPKEAYDKAQMVKLLEHGRNLWVVTDFTRCQGRGADSTAMLGSAISNYDLVNQGKALEMFLPLNQVNSHLSHKHHLTGFVIQILQSGDVILTWVSGANEVARKRKFNISSAYHCELSNQLSARTNKSRRGGVRVFYR